MVKSIENLPVGTIFFLRNLIDNPPSLLGKWLYDHVESGDIKNVKHLGNDGSDAEKYEKI